MRAAEPAAEPEVMVLREGGAGIIRLNRPKALNALSLPMIRTIRGALEEFSQDEMIGRVVLEGAGERGFCAGGDIRAIYESGKARDGMPAIFWAEEYGTVSVISRYPKPIVALMHGLVMGGGAGLSIHASHRIVTDSTRFAMPEVGIGFIPDVGASWRLPRAPAETGRYIALTGETVGAADVIEAGLADAYIPAESLAAFRRDLVALPAGTDSQTVNAAINHHRGRPAPGTFNEHRTKIAASFRPEALDEILSVLDRDASDFSGKTAATIRSRSPTSLRLTVELLRLGRDAGSLEECLTREFHAACLLLKGHDFYEGVRAAVIDKDRNPQWSPAYLAEVPALNPLDLEFTDGVRPPSFPHLGESI